MPTFYLDYDIHRALEPKPSRKPNTLRCKMIDLPARASSLVESTVNEGQIMIYTDAARFELVGYAIKYPDKAGYFEGATHG